jgi:hypothetical protein
MSFREGKREAVAHQKAVAGVLGVSTVRRTVEPRHDRLVAELFYAIKESAQVNLVKKIVMRPVASLVP